jgi:hypothetical protein
VLWELSEGRGMSWIGFGNFEREVCMGCVFKDGLFLKRIDYGLCFLFGFFRF